MLTCSPEPTSKVTDAAKAAVFNDWIARHYESPLSLEVRPTPGMRFGAYATRDIAEGHVYSSTPAKLLIGAEAIQRAGKGAYLQTGLAGALLLFLLAEFHKGEQSFWHPYIQILPEPADYAAVPSYWPENELHATLSGTACYDNVMAGKAEESSEFTRLNTFLVDNDPDLAARFTFDDFKWARTVRDSRTIWLGGRERQFVPMLDMINCRHHTDPQKIHHTRYGPKRSADTVALWNFKAGQQVFENYGQTNLMYYQYHAFTIPRNVYDCYTVYLGHLLATANAWAKRHQHPPIQTSDFCISTKKGVPPEVPRIFAMAAASRRGDTRLDLVRGYRALEKHLQGKVAAIPSSSAEDKQLLSQEGVSARLQEAIRYRASERRLLQQLVDWAKAQQVFARTGSGRNDEL